MTNKLKGILAAAVILILTVLIGLVIYGNSQKAAYLQAKGVAAVLEKQFKDYQTQAEKTKAALADEAIKLAAEKNAAIEKANAAAGQAAVIQAALDAEKAKTAALTPDALSEKINARIGAGQSWPIAAGTFTFTRPGAESTLNLFLEGEATASKYQAERNVTANLRGAVDAAEKEMVNLGRRLLITEDALDKCAIWGQAEQDARKHLERSLTGRTIKTAVISAGAGALIVFILHAVNIIK